MKKCSLAMILILSVLLSCLTAVAGRVDKVELSSHYTTYYSVQERLKNVTDEKRNIEEVKAELLSLHPSARIRVVNETLHVVIDDPALSIEKAENDRATSVYAPMGGAFRNFSVPSYSMMIPLSQVYMSAQAVQARLEQLANPTFWRWVKQELIAGVSAAAIAATAIHLWGITIPTFIVTIMGSFTAWALTNLDYWSLQSARDQSASGKVQVLRYMTSDGYFALVYSPWNSNHCTTQGGFNASWYGGDYEF